jgi:hypothetical protein
LKEKFDERPGFWQSGQNLIPGRYNSINGMANIKFSCPHCQQHIEADSGYAGVQINCPACKGGMVVPGGAPAPAPIAISAAPPTPAPLHLQAPRASASACPSCKAAMPPGAVLCVSCGYNLATGKRTVTGGPTALGKSASYQRNVPWYKTPYPYIGGVLVLLGILYFLGKSNPPMMLAFVGVAALYTLLVHLLVLIAAFRTDVGTGFLALCIPFYALYFVFKVHDNDTLKVLYVSAVIIQIAIKAMGSLD